MVLALVLSVSSGATAVRVYWSDWISGTPGTVGTATGALDFGGDTIDLSYGGELASIQSGRPLQAATKTLSFSQPVDDLFFVIVTLIGNGYRFDRDFEIVSSGAGYSGNGTCAGAIRCRDSVRRRAPRGPQSGLAFFAKPCAQM